MHAEIAELDRIRLVENLSYYELGARCGIPEATMRRTLQAVNPKVYDRTLFRMRAYLERRKQAEQRQRQAERTKTQRARYAEVVE